MPVRRLGADAEDQAAAYLLNRGWTLVTRRWKGQKGELDIVALDGETLVVVEVKARRAGSAPEESFTPAKIKRLKLAAAEYLHATGLEPEAMRYDLLAIEGTVLRHFENAFDTDAGVALGEGEYEV